MQCVSDSRVPSLVEWFLEHSDIVDDDILDVSDKQRLSQLVLHLNVLNVDRVQLHVLGVQIKVLLADTHTMADCYTQPTSHRVP